MRSKYGNKKTVVDGITFDSIKEGKRYSELRLLEKAGEISELELQPKYDLVINNIKVCRYVGDFKYRLGTCGQYILEDCKGFKTQTYRLKAKLMKAVHGIVVTET